MGCPFPFGQRRYLFPSLWTHGGLCVYRRGAFFSYHSAVLSVLDTALAERPPFYDLQPRPLQRNHLGNYRLSDDHGVKSLQFYKVFIFTLLLCWMPSNTEHAHTLVLREVFWVQIPMSTFQMRKWTAVKGSWGL